MKDINEAVKIVSEKFQNSNFFNEYFDSDTFKYVGFNDIFYHYIYEEMGEIYSDNNYKLLDDNFDLLSGKANELINDSTIETNYYKAVINLAKENNKMNKIVENDQFYFFKSAVDEYYNDDLKTTEEIRNSKKQVLKNIDISIIKKIVDLNNYNTIELIPDEHFTKLSSNEIAKLYLNCDIDDCKYDKEKINFLIEDGNYLDVVDIVKIPELYTAKDLQKIVYTEMDTMDNELFNKISEHNDFNNIEYCEAVKKDDFYIKSLIENGYLNIIWSLKVEQFVEPLLSVISEHIVDALYLYGKKDLLESDVVYNLAFSKCNTPEDFDNLLKSIPEQFLTEERRAECLFRIGKIDEKDKISYEDIKREFEKGNPIPETLLNILSDEDIIKLINDNHLEIIEIVPTFKLNKNILLEAFSKGYIPNEEISKITLDKITKEDFDQLIESGNYPAVFAYFKVYKEFTNLLPSTIFDSLFNSVYKEQLLEMGLVDKCLFDKLFKCEIYNVEEGKNYFDDKFINEYNLNNTIKEYIAFTRNCDFFLNDYIKCADDINLYFNENGPIKNLYDLSFTNEKFHAYLFKDDMWKNYYSDNEIAAIETFHGCVDKYGFIFNKTINNFDEIFKSFNKDGITSYGIQKVFELGLNNAYNNKDYFELLDKDEFKGYYYENYNIHVLNNLLNHFDNNYSYFIYFINETIGLPIPLNENDSKIIEDKLCLDILDEKKVIDIIKYIFYAKIELRSKIIDIIKNNELRSVLNIYSTILPEYDAKTLVSVVDNYLNNIELMNNLKGCTELNDEEKSCLRMILVNGDKNAQNKIKTKEDLSNYNKIMYDENNIIISSFNIDEIKKFIFMSMFNINTSLLSNKLARNEGNELDKLKENIVNNNTKELLVDYQNVFNIMSDIYYCNEIEVLRNIATSINQLYKNNNNNVLINSWNCFSKIDKTLMSFVGEELNEKITNFDELLNCPPENIPKMADGEDSFIVSEVSVKDDFTYDNETISKDTKVKMIELNGLPFVTCGHVLNAFGKGGKLSDFNHPRVIGNTHLCLSAIDDNFYSFARRFDSDINHVTVLFSELPSDKLAVASEKDMQSSSSDNTLSIATSHSGKYNPVRETISITPVTEYNEYTFFRDGIVPTAIFAGPNSEYGIQAAAYLSKVFGRDIPIVTLNPKKYPPLSVEQKKEKDAMLQETFYKYIHRDNNLKELNDKKELVHNLTDYLREICSGLGEYSNEESLVR